MKREIGNSYGEYRYFIRNYLFPLLGMPNENNIEQYDGEKAKDALVYYENGYLIFANRYRNMLRVRVQRDISEDNIKLAINIILSFFVISKYRIDEKSSKKINNRYSSESQLEVVYKMAVQKGICNWIVGWNSDKVEKLFHILEKWSVQTYEGRRVTFGFIINPDIECTPDEKYGTWFDFLDDDFSAVFTDCVNTVIELDRNCNFYKYCSITENNEVASYLLTHETSYRFSNIMQEFVAQNRVGVFLLSNGDIIISKAGAIRFVKRNLKWLNFSYEAFKNAFGDFVEKEKIDDILLKEVFASMLDVSFSHTGGIISVVSELEKIVTEKPILSVSDNLLNGKSNEEIECELKAQGVNKIQEIKKRILKRRMLEAFIAKKNFMQLDRKLRCELISLDGECILDKKGNICSCGAIIKNDSGSSGGGRGAASKKLSACGF